MNEIHVTLNMSDWVYIAFSALLEVETITVTFQPLLIYRYIFNVRNLKPEPKF